VIGLAHRRLACSLRALLLLALAAAPTVAHAQTLKDSLEDHVREGIERSREKKQKKAKKKKKAREKKADAEPKPEPKADQAPAPSPPAEPSPPPEPVAPDPEPGAPSPTHEPPAADRVPALAPAQRAQSGPQVAISSAAVTPSGGAAAPEPDAGPKLPVRVLGKNLRLDVTVGVGYRGWVPQQYDVVDVDVGSYLTWNIDVKARLFGFLNLRRGYYESNGVSAPRTDEVAVAARIGSFAPKAVWLLGVLGVPINKAWEPQVRYESRAFETHAQPISDVCLVDRDAPEDATEACPGRTMGELKIISGFETFVAGVNYDHSKTGSPVVSEKAQKFPPLFFGIGLMQYRKPYQLNVDGFTLERYLFDARFRGAGLALGTELGGGLDNVFAEIDAQLGLGEVSLTDEITLNELVPDDQLIGYVQGTATLGYRLPLIRAAPTLIFVPAVKAGGASFFLVDTNTEEDETATSPSVNWDFLWTVQASLLIPF
jgi:hypothetical protein